MTYLGESHVKADALTIPKMWYFSSFKGFEPELLAVKVKSNFGKSARFQVPKNGTLSAQIFKRTPKTPQNTPQNGGIDIWFMRLSLLGVFLADFGKLCFIDRFRAIFPAK